jgi:hypothetical protein
LGVYDYRDKRKLWYHLCVRPPQRLYNALRMEILKQFFQVVLLLYSGQRLLLLEQCGMVNYTDVG